MGVGEAGEASHNGANGGGLGRRAISYDKFATMMQSSFRRRFDAGETIFRRGDKARDIAEISRRDISRRDRAPICFEFRLVRTHNIVQVSGFYIIMEGECVVEQPPRGNSSVSEVHRDKSPR